MDIWEILIIALAIVIITPIWFAIIWFCKTRGEKKISTDGFIRTRPPKLLSGFFLGFALFVLCAGIAGIVYCCVTDSEHTTVTQIVTLSLCIAAFSAIGFFGYAYVRFNYVIADNEGVWVYKLLRKKRYYRYDEIMYYKDTINMGIAGDLSGYDKNNKKIFSIEAVHIGAKAVAQKLHDCGVEEKVEIKPLF